MVLGTGATSVSPSTHATKQIVLHFAPRLINLEPNQIDLFIDNIIWSKLNELHMLIFLAALNEIVMKKKVGSTLQLATTSLQLILSRIIR
jgi:hypothetical protein